MRKNINYMKILNKYLKEQKWLVSAVLLFSIVTAILSLVFPWVWGNILTNFISIKSLTYNIVIKYVIIYIVLEFLEGIIKIIDSYIFARLEEKLTTQLKVDLYSKILNLETKAYDKNRPSFFVQKITEEPHILVAAFVNLMNMAINLVKVICICGIAFSICRDVGIILVVATVVIYTSVVKLRPTINKSLRIQNNHVRKYINDLYSYIRNVREIKSLGVKTKVKEILKDKNTEVNETILSVKTSDNLMKLLTFIMKFSLHSVVLVIATYYLFAGIINFIDFIILESYTIILYVTVDKMTEFPNVMIAFKNSLKSIFDLMTNRMYGNEKYGKVEYVSDDANLVVKNLSFSFGTNKMLLDNITFDVMKNTKVAVVDRGGNAKSVFLNLLLRYYDPIEGRIMLGDVNIKELSERALRKNIMLISQSPMIFDDTLENNIKLLTPNATTTEMIEVCKKTNILNWFDTSIMDEILNTKLGEGGMKLTAAQKQLIAIARVMLVKPKIIIFDELTSEVTSDEAFLIKRAMDEIEDSTILILSDRIFSITTCDELITLKNSQLTGISARKDIIHERNMYTKFATRKLNDDDTKDNKKKNNKQQNEYCEYNTFESNDDIIKDEYHDIKGRKEVRNDEEHRIFSQIW